jgi:hypothetical protein
MISKQAGFPTEFVLMALILMAEISQAINAQFRNSCGGMDGWIKRIAETFSIIPVVGTKDDMRLVENDEHSIQIRIPDNEVNGIGTYFNRAVVSSHSFQGII